MSEQDIVRDAMQANRRLLAEVTRRLRGLFPLDSAIKLELNKVAGKELQVQNQAVQYRPQEGSM